MKTNKIYNEDCIDTMKRMPDGFVDLVVTSPPYDDLRSYEGYTFDFERVAREMLRIMKPGGIVVWVVNDSIKDWDRSGTSFRQALFFKQIGFKLVDTMIYRRENVLPNRPGFYAGAFEFMFILSDGKPQVRNILKDRPNKMAGQKWKAYDRPCPRGKDGVIRKQRKELVMAPFGVRHNVWSYQTGGGKTTKDKIAGRHPATFPDQLAADHILSWSNEGDIVYDPFMGSGTTAKMALLLKRRFIGSEISKKYCDLARRRLDPYIRQKKLL